MELLVKSCWGILALVHVAPAMVFFKPNLVERLYGAAPGDDIGILLVHRGALFLAIVSAAIFATFDPAARKACSVIVAISVIGFLFVYAAQGFPAGPLRKIALMDLVAVAPLVIVSFAAWRG